MDSIIDNNKSNNEIIYMDISNIFTNFIINISIFFNTRYKQKEIGTFVPILLVNN